MNDENDRARAFSERHWADVEKAAEAMWHELLAETVLELFKIQKTVSRNDITEALELRLGEEGTDRITKAKARGALRALRG